MEEGEHRVFEPTLHDAELTGQLGTWAKSSMYMQAAMQDCGGELPMSSAADERTAEHPLAHKPTNCFGA